MKFGTKVALKSSEDTLLGTINSKTGGNFVTIDHDYHWTGAGKPTKLIYNINELVVWLPDTTTMRAGDQAAHKSEPNEYIGRVNKTDGDHIWIKDTRSIVPAGQIGGLTSEFPIIKYKKSEIVPLQLRKSNKK